MERRELLKALATVPFVRLPFKDTEVDAVEIAPKKYWVFYDHQRIDINDFVTTPWPWPGIDAEFFPVRTYGGKSVKDTIAIYKIGE